MGNVAMGSVREVEYCPNEILSQEAFNNGIRRYAQAACMLGMDEKCHSKFMVDCCSDGINYKLAGQFVWNVAGKNMAVDKINYLIENSDMMLIPDVGIGEMREMWPGAVCMYYDEALDSGCFSEILLSNSGVPSFVDIVLVASFAIGMNEADPNWDLSVFREDSQYVGAFNLARELIKLYFETQCDDEINPDLCCVDLVDDKEWQLWMRGAQLTIPRSDYLII